MLERLLDPYFLGTIAFIVVGCGILGIGMRLTIKNINLLVLRQVVGMFLFLTFIYVVFTVYQTASTPPDPQMLIPDPEEGTDWFTLVTSTLAIYVGAWAFIWGVEKKMPPSLVFFSSSFYREVKNKRPYN